MPRPGWIEASNNGSLLPVPYRRTPAVDDRLAAARERLVSAATDVVASSGWTGASVTAVAAAAGISVGSVYQHFPSKAALVVEVFRRAAGREVEVLTDVLAPPAPGQAAVESPVDRLARGVATFARRALARRGLAYALLVAPSEPAVEQERLEFRRRYRDAFVAVLTEGVEAGLLPPQDVRVTAAALTGAIGEVLVGPVSMSADAPGGDDADDIVREVTAMALRCVGAAPRPAEAPVRAAGTAAPAAPAVPSPSAPADGAAGS